MSRPDQDWLRLQKVVFARYVQQKLRGSGREEEKQCVVTDLAKDMADGTLLVKLVEVLSGQTMKKKIKAETARIKIINNVNEALKFVEGVGIDLKRVRVQAEDLVDAKEMAVLALVFQIIIKYLKFSEDDDEKDDDIDVRSALSLWLSNKIDGYENCPSVALKGKKIPTKSFHNGMVFNALVHKMRPKLVDYSGLNPDNKIENLNQALDLAEKYLNIEKYVCAEDIAKMDELSIIVYLSDWFNGVILLQRQDIAARRIGKLVDLTILHDKLRAQYTEAGNDFKAWVATKIVALNKREFDGTLAGAKAKLEEFYAYKAGEKGEWVGKKIDITGLFNNLQARLANHKRPVWAAPDGTSPTDLDSKLDELAQIEIARAIDLQKELARQIKLHKMYKRFSANSQKLQDWGASKQAYASERETIDTVEGGEDALESLNVHDKEQQHVQDSGLADLAGLGKELVDEKFELSDDVTAKSAAAEDLFKGLAAQCAEKKTYLEAELQKQKDLNDMLCKAFAGAASAFDSWLKEKRDALAGQEEGDLEAQLASVSEQMDATKEADDSLADIAAKDKAVQDREIGINPHTNLTAGDLKASWSMYLVLLGKKKSLLEEQIEEAKRGGLTPEQAEEIDSNFTYFDKDKSGFLNKKELRVCLQSLGEESRPQDIAEILEKYDTDKSGTVKRDEFVEFMKANLGDSGTEPEIITAFKYLCYDKEFIVESEMINVVNDKSFKDHHVEYLKKELKAAGEGLDYPTWTGEAFAR